MSVTSDADRLGQDRLELRLADKKPLYAPAEAIAEANRCLYCSDAPCIDACPTGIDVPTFIHKIGTGNVKGAARTIFHENLLGYSCARVCPVEVLCAGACVYNEWGRAPIEIGRLQRFATETALRGEQRLLVPSPKASSGKKIALIGAGPASIAAAGHLALEGHAAMILERRQLPGGLNTLGIAPYKLHAQDALWEIAFLRAVGDVQIRTGVEVVRGEAGQGQVSTEALLNDYDAIFIGIGLGPDSKLGIPGEEGPGIVGAVDYIEQLKSANGMTLQGIRRAVVVGGGNTAIDVARQLALLGVPEVTVAYRRTVARMPGYAHELAWARREGVRVLEDRAPVEVLRDGRDQVTGLRVAPAVDGKPTGDGTELVPCDLIAVAIGQARLTELAEAFEGVELDSKGRVIVDEASCRTGHARVYAGGDCVNGGKEVVNAVEHGKVAARAIHLAFSS